MTSHHKYTLTISIPESIENAIYKETQISKFSTNDEYLENLANTLLYRHLKPISDRLAGDQQQAKDSRKMQAMIERDRENRLTDFISGNFSPQ